MNIYKVTLKGSLILWIASKDALRMTDLPSSLVKSVMLFNDPEKIDGPGIDLIIGEATQYKNHYYCGSCNISWEDIWTSMCNDRCPQCRAEIEPEKSEEV